MKKLLGISGGLIAMIVAKVLIKSLALNALDDPNYEAYKTKLNTATTKMDSLNIALEFNIINADTLAKKIIAANPDIEKLIKTYFENGRSTEKIKSDLNLLFNYPYLIDLALIEQIGIKVAQTNENFSFQEKVPQEVDITKFLSIKHCVNKNPVTYLKIPTKNPNILIYQDTQHAVFKKYIFSSNGYFCLQLKNGERKYGTWKNVGKNSFECEYKDKDYTETLYFEPTAKEIWRKV